jgi:hypothetical protein
MNPCKTEIHPRGNTTPNNKASSSINESIERQDAESAKFGKRRRKPNPTFLAF